MSKNFFEQLKQTKDQISLSKSEQQHGRQELASFLQRNAVIKNELAGHGNQKASNFLNILTQPFMSKFKLSYLAVPVIVVGLGAGISLAAENSLPGDFLYPVKIHVNENVEAALSLSTKSKADLNLKLAQTRLQEAEDLSAQGKLSDQAKQQLTADFQKHSDQFDQNVAKLKAENDSSEADQEDSNFQASLNSHQAILGSLGITNALEHGDNRSSTATTQLNTLKSDFEAGNTPGTTPGASTEASKTEDQKSGTETSASSSSTELKSSTESETTDKTGSTTTVVPKEDGTELSGSTETHLQTDLSGVTLSAEDSTETSTTK